MKYNIFILFMLVVACSTHIEKDTLQESEKAKETSQRDKEQAQQLFIDASTLDIEGKYAEAILDYQEALKLDPSSGIYYVLAKDYLRLTKLSPALENSKKSVEMEPENTEYLTLLGTIYSFSQLPDSAETIFEKIVKLDSTDVNARFNLAQLNEKDKPTKALELYKEILKITGPEWNVLIKIADLNDRLGQVEQTVSTVEELLELNPSSLKLQKLLIESYIKTEKYDKALKLVDNSLEIFPDDLNLIELKGNTYVKMKEWEKGAAEYKKILSKPKVPFDIKMRIGTAFYSEALKDSTVLPVAFDVLQQVDQDSADWQINAFMGELSSKQKNDSLTLYYFNKAIELAPMNPDLRIRLGQILFQNGDFKTDIEEMKKAVKNFPNNFVINLILGLSYSQENDNENALQYLKKSVEINPNDLNATMAYSFSLQQTNQNDEALKYLERALRIDPENVQAFSLMGMIYDGKDMFNKSDSIYDIAVSLDSTDILTLNNYAYSLAERGVKLDKALKMVKVAVDGDPENSSYLDTMGWVYFKMNKFEEARDYIEKAIKFDGGNATLLDHLGDVYYKLNQKEKAKEFWEKAFSIDKTLVNIQQKIEKGLE